eukprot:CAMPEP_0117659726 /NCGR_PEP_ID=MMETSP0804-20121206/6586_1 /TAXON_ID=1074897 /ORGANISM="Tetraselmis astigmatica, Strain CCMP880" /LENGTH=321 /DNA_ID=CAMNT_0005466403 /DNA_START=29 /DNA_END=990 /DNA_ORIENTATION=+
MAVVVSASRAPLLGRTVFAGQPDARFHSWHNVRCPPSLPSPPSSATATEGRGLSASGWGDIKQAGCRLKQERMNEVCRAADVDSNGGRGVDSEGGYWRRSADVVRDEMLECFKIVDRMRPGVVYFGSARIPEDHPHFQQAKDLSKEVAQLLGGATTWSGLGGGMMEAVSQGALEAGAPAAGFKIFREGGRWVGLDGSWEHPYLPRENSVTCEFFSARKHGLAEAASRRAVSDRTAVVVLPGGTGTLDEVFEVIVLIQLDKLGADLKVPVILVNYGGFYDNLLAFLDDAVEYGAIGKDELRSMFTVCDTNQDALDHIREFYG